MSTSYPMEKPKTSIIWKRAGCLVSGHVSSPNMAFSPHISEPAAPRVKISSISIPSGRRRVPVYVCVELVLQTSIWMLED